MATTASGAFPVRLDVAWAMEFEQILAHESQHPGHRGETAEKEERQSEGHWVWLGAEAESHG